MSFPRTRLGLALARGIAVMLVLAAASTACSSADPKGKAGGAGGGEASAGAEAPTADVTPEKAQIGAYLQISGRTISESLALRKQQLGRDPQILQWFYKWTDDLPKTYPNAPAGTKVMVSWHGTSYASVNSGAEDARIRKNAKALKAYGKPIYVRWAFEMNGNWFPWSGVKQGSDPSKFVAAWRRIHGIFKAEGATNVQWVWSVNWGSEPAAEWNSIDKYYPGDEYVDVAGVDGYSNGTTTPEDLFGDFYKKYAPRKPIMITETSVRDAGGTTVPDWIGLLAEWAATHPKLVGIIWFDTNGHVNWSGRIEDWRVDRSPESLAAYKKLFNHPRFAA
ncbi:glycoside hydrolase family 26 protein [Longispora albida]|uniref:glycoside hydrolase family 26 protein n=1 Tax=Longispora albida TaxID=203523 RepID=UPI000382E3F9|nr:glycosyl hydrolase [Longispora albida]